MNTCMYTCIHVYMYTCVCVHVYIYIYIYTCINIYECIGTCMYMCVCMCTSVRPVHLLRVSLLRVLESTFPGDSL